ncbi:MAG: DUF4845 domain-containing protein [Gammaproteobacteria bacterium]|nr:DUF4845 domain-containing protein [Gammaproteobacteria bacterium]
MYQKQRGASMWQWMFYAAVGFLGLYVALNLTPIYIEGMSVRQALAKLEHQGGGSSKREIMAKLEKQFQLDQVNSVKKEHIKFRQVRDGKLEVTIEYEKRVPLIGNLYLLVDFKNKATI